MRLTPVEPLNGAVAAPPLRSTPLSDFLILLTIYRINEGPSDRPASAGHAPTDARWMCLHIEMISDALSSPMSYIHRVVVTT